MFSSGDITSAADPTGEFTYNLVTAPERLLRAPRAAVGFYAADLEFTAPADTSTDWIGEFPDRGRRSPPRVTGWFATDLEAVVAADTSTDWFGTYPDQIRRVRYTSLPSYFSGQPTLVSDCGEIGLRTGILDDFNRPNEGPPPSSDWEAGLFFTSGFEVLSNEAAGLFAQDGSNLWNTFSALNDLEVYVTCATRCDDLDRFSVEIVQNDAVDYDGYTARLDRNDSTGDVFQLRRWDNGSTSAGGALDSAVVDFQDGDAIGMRRVGTQLEGWYRPVGGNWRLLLTATDATYLTIPLKIGIWADNQVSGTPLRLDDFGGGIIDCRGLYNFGLTTYPDQLRRAPRAAQGWVAGDPEDLAAPADTSTDWLPTYPDRGRRAIPRATGWFAEDLGGPSDLGGRDVDLVTAPDSLHRGRRASLGHFAADLQSDDADGLLSFNLVAEAPDALHRGRRASVGWFTEDLGVRPDLGGSDVDLGFAPAVLHRGRRVSLGYYAEDLGGPTDPDGQFAHNLVTAPHVLHRKARAAIGRFAADLDTPTLSDPVGAFTVYPDRLLRAPRAAVGWFADALDADIAPLDETTDWLPSYPDRLRRKPRAAVGWFDGDLALAPDPDGQFSFHLVVAPSSLHRGRRAAVGWWAGDLEFTLVTTEWLPSYPDYQLHRKARAAVGFNVGDPTSSLPPSDPNGLFSFTLVVAPDALLGARRAAVGFDTGTPSTGVVITDQTTDWLSVYPDLLRRRPRAAVGWWAGQAILGSQAFIPPPGIHRIPVEEFFPWQRPVISILATPPAAPVCGDRYIVATGGTGAWAGADTFITWWNGTAWQFDIPSDGWMAVNLADSTLKLFLAGAWATYP